MRTLFTVAWVAVAAPLVVGTVVFVAWLLARLDALMAAGVFTIYAGLCSVAVASVCLAIYLWRNWRSTEVPRRRLVRQAATLVGLVIVNFVAAGGFVFGAMMIEARYNLSITNGGSEPLHNVRVGVGKFGVDFGDIPAGGIAKRGFWIEGEGALVLTASRGEQKIEGVVDGYVTPNMGRNVEVVVNPHGEVIVEEEGSASRSKPSSANTPQQMFQHTIQNPIPPSVMNLQGVGDTWQGYSLYLRFNASKADIDAVIAQGFKPATWASISYRFTLPAAYDRFTPHWDPASISTKECYELGDVKNGWTHQGTHYLVIDRSTGTVYFYGIGA